MCEYVVGKKMQLCADILNTLKSVTKLVFSARLEMIIPWELFNPLAVVL